ncbi:IucA/IucC family protein [Priestia megaterium]|uniref:IucA/IucC family protein n=1 Tax=Priestia megaterium TaxID=1404 RepID=UPI00046F4D69|nr:IucA/IucC family siderophore biosynthesis protein [Priestia megaterium]PFA97202.1 IucA/IucC family siderophore biosynthesis protein [Priestia megaterium]TCN16028.1 siderophore synthetase component [Bacillus sp. BK006]
MKIKETNLSVFNKQSWEKANRQLLAKMLQEFMYENIIDPKQLQKQGALATYRWEDHRGVTYTYQAKQRLFDSFSVLPESIKLTSKASTPTFSEALQLLISLSEDKGMSSSTAGHLAKEYFHTLIADVHLQNRKSADELAGMDYAELEGEMTGHPWITYNKGRIGFGYDDYLRFAPEQKQKIQLSWIAVAKQIASFHSLDTLGFDDVMKQELSGERLAEFEKELTSQDLLAADYYYIPVHEWQWMNVIVPLFAEYIANDLIVPLGEGEDQYLPQQSIRTFVNTTNRDKYHVKLPMSILNTLVYRGLPSERTVIAPQVTQHIKGIRDRDAFLKDTCKVGLLGEVATLNVTQPTFASIKNAPYQYLEMLGVVWRESIYQELEEGEHAITLAALLHVDSKGKALVSSYIEKSGLTPAEWIDALTSAVLPPLLHYLYQYGTVFSPHGQNTVLVLKHNKPVRIIMKDFVDDVNISDQPFEELQQLSFELKEVLRSEEPEGLTQFILTGLFVCHFRYLATILEEHEGVEEADFWRSVRAGILHYQASFPHLKKRFELFDLLRPTITKLTLNRNRMFDYGYEDDGDRPHASEYGKVRNALHEVSEKAVQ